MFAPMALVAELEVPQRIVGGGIPETPSNLFKVGSKVGDVVVGVGDKNLGFARRAFNGIRDVVGSEPWESRLRQGKRLGPIDPRRVGVTVFEFATGMSAQCRDAVKMIEEDAKVFVG